MIELKNTKNAYGLIAKIFHWPTALIMLCLILVGLYMGSMPNSPEKFQVYAMHKSFGLLVLWLVGLRIVWRLINVQPAPHDNHQGWEKLLAKLVHFILYVAMIGMPLSGWLMSSAGEHPVPFFGLQMPDLVGKNPELGKAMREVHEILGFTLIVAVLLHGIGALKHHFIDKDDTLIRMAAGPMKRFGPYIAAAVLLLFTLGVGVLVLSEDEEEKPVAAQQSSVQEAVPQTIVQGQGRWQIIEDQSSLIFKASVYGKEFTGTFGKFGGDIVFKPDDLAASHADIAINTKTIDSADAERDAQIMGAEWFDVATYPTARFKTVDFQAANDGQYVAVAEITIKNHSMPVTLPFKLDLVPQSDGTVKAFVSADLTLNRLDFGLGEGRWEAADFVGLTVDVQLKMVAVSV